MSTNVKATCCISLLLIIFSVNSSAQNEGGNYYAERQVELMHDNDFLHFTDRWYTTGSFISYRKLLNERNEDIPNRRQLTFQLEQSFYTPSNILSSRIEDYDRPYAGFLGLNTSLTLTSERRMLDFTFTIGVTGEISGSEGLQNWFHSTNESQATQWTGQIENNTHANLYGSYLREWKVYSGFLDAILATKPKVALGTKDYYLENTMTLFLGKRNAMENTMAYRQLGTIENELFFALTGAYRYVIHDAMLQGSIISDNSEFTLEPVNSLIFYGAEMYWRTRRMDFKVAYMFTTKRAESTGTHGFSTLSISRNF